MSDFQNSCREVKMSLATAVSVQGLVKTFKDRNSRVTPLHGDGNPIGIQDVTFDLGQNEVIGIIGKNGAGKTTLLRILSGIMTPDKGAVHFSHVPHAVLGLGNLYDPTLTGRKNVQRELILRGLDRAKVDELLDDIADFAELGEYFDRKVRTYSTGMIARLSFAAAVSCQPEILLIDEVLSVGDSYFCQKSIARIKELFRQGTAGIVVSHNWPLLMQVSDRIAIMENGRITAIGQPLDIMYKYLLDNNITPTKECPELSFQEVEIKRVSKSNLFVAVSLTSVIPLSELQINFYFWRNDKGNRFICIQKYIERNVQDYSGLYEVPANVLSAGEYFVTVAVQKKPIAGGTREGEVLCAASWATGWDLTFKIEPPLLGRNPNLQGGNPLLTIEPQWSFSLGGADDTNFIG